MGRRLGRLSRQERMIGKNSSFSFGLKAIKYCSLRWSSLTAINLSPSYLLGGPGSGHSWVTVVMVTFPYENTSNFSSYFGGLWSASGAMKASVPLTDDFLVILEESRARDIPKSVTLVTKETSFNRMLFGLRSWWTRGGLRLWR